MTVCVTSYFHFCTRLLGSTSVAYLHLRFSIVPHSPFICVPSLLRFISPSMFSSSSTPSLLSSLKRPFFPFPCLRIPRYLIRLIYPLLFLLSIHPFVRLVIACPLMFPLHTCSSHSSIHPFAPSILSRHLMSWFALSSSYGVIPLCVIFCSPLSPPPPPFPSSPHCSSMPRFAWRLSIPFLLTFILYHLSLSLYFVFFLVKCLIRLVLPLSIFLFMVLFFLLS